MQNQIPLVSVVIPMFNAAKFISQTLESLLYQTLTDFEVVVVDDCSIDNSIEVVESFSERFGGRLKVIKLPKNTGTPGLPRNVGIQIAHGKYIAFLDSDDLFTKTALEELSTLAEKFQADVVRTNSWFVLWNDKKKHVDDPAFTDMKELTNPANRMTKNELDPRLLTMPTLIPEDTSERVKDFINWGTLWTSWLSFCRRDFLLTNQIIFPDMNKSEDASFVLECAILAKNFLRVPNAVYTQRPRTGSASRYNNENFNAGDYIHKNLAPIRRGFNELERAMKKSSFFENRPDYRYAVLDFFFWKSFSWLGPLQNLYMQNPAYKLNGLVKKEFNPDDAALVSYLFDKTTIYQIQIAILQQKIAALKKSKQQELFNV